MPINNTLFSSFEKADPDTIFLPTIYSIAYVSASLFQELHFNIMNL